MGRIRILCLLFWLAKQHRIEWGMRRGGGREEGKEKEVHKTKEQRDRREVERGERKVYLEQ